MNDNASKANLKPIRQRILDQLALLGRNKDEIAYALKERGIKGARRRCNSCPIAEYLMKQNPELSMVSVSENIELFKDESIKDMNVPILLHHLFQDIARIDTPFAISDFISAFDSGAYPELERPI